MSKEDRAFVLHNDFLPPVERQLRMMARVFREVEMARVREERLKVKNMVLVAYPTVLVAYPTVLVAYAGF